MWSCDLETVPEDICTSSALLVGSLSSHEYSSKENVTSKHTSMLLELLHTCKMSPNYSGTELVVVAFKFRNKTKNSLLHVQVLCETLNLVIIHHCFAEDDEEIYQNVEIYHTRAELLFCKWVFCLVLFPIPSFCTCLSSWQIEISFLP